MLGVRDRYLMAVFAIAFFVAIASVGYRARNDARRGSSSHSGIVLERSVPADSLARGGGITEHRPAQIVQRVRLDDGRVVS